MNASRMMARMTTTNQKKNTTMAGMAYPATVLDLATAASYPLPSRLFGDRRLPVPGNAMPIDAAVTGLDVR